MSKQTMTRMRVVRKVPAVERGEPQVPPQLIQILAQLYLYELRRGKPPEAEPAESAVATLPSPPPGE